MIFVADSRMMLLGDFSMENNELCNESEAAKEPKSSGCMMVQNIAWNESR